MRIFVMFSGVPGSGKSSYIPTLEKIMNRTFKVLSTDDYIERESRKMGKTYSEGFPLLIKTATEFNDHNRKLYFERQWFSILDDQTNLTLAGRAKKLSEVPSNYLKICYFFYSPPAEEHKRRLESRPGKVIPDNVIRDMNSRLIVPELSEGFDMVGFIKTF